MGDRPPAPICGEEVNASFIDDGTMCLWQSNAPAPSGPGPVPADVAGRVREAMERALPLLPAEVAHEVAAMISPESILIVVGTLVVWAGSHFFGAGEIVDVILLVVGFAFLGAGVFSGAHQLYDFATSAIHAQSEADLDRAAQHFASAVTILGITVVTALLMRRSARAVRARPSQPLELGLLEMDPPPPPGTPPTIKRPPALASGALGETDWYGNIAVARNQSLAEQRLTLYHEWVHSVLSPRVAPLRQLRASLRASAYWRSALMQYLEEAMAESYAQLRAQGLSGVVTGIRFPIKRGYITLSELKAEGTAIGTIVLGGAQFSVVRERRRRQAAVTEQEAIERAKAFAGERGWAWVEPARARRLPAHGGEPERWEVRSHARGGLGAMARVVIDAATGAVLDQGYVPR